MSKLIGENVLMRIFIGEQDRHHHMPLYEALPAPPSCEA